MLEYISGSSNVLNLRLFEVHMTERLDSRGWSVDWPLYQSLSKYKQVRTWEEKL